MSEPKPRTCPRCDAPLPAAAAERPCPACLVSGALCGEDGGAPAGTTAPADGGELPREFGGYRLLARLGGGGMGTVYEAEHRASGRRVALKMLAQRLDSPEMRQRFLREGRLAASVNHPNSLYVYGSEEIGDAPVITMEIAPGGTLEDELSRRGPFAVAAAVDAILDVIAGLEAADAAGVLHRDVKPSNCFRGPNGAVKVGDFGLSVSTVTGDESYATLAGVIMGTPAFAAPEQLRGDELDVRADIYSVGATLFTLLTGRAPFDGKNAVQVVANAIDQEPKSLGEFRDDVPPGLARAVGRCLAKDRERRYADYSALREALLPFGSREAEPAAMTIRAAAGWVDYLAAFLVPYVILVLVLGNDAFHIGPLVERTLYSARGYFALLGLGLLYFTITEGIWGAGPGKRLKGLMVVRTNGGRPGVWRALVRILVQVLSIEGVRVPILLAFVAAPSIDQLSTADVLVYSLTTALCPWIPALLAWRVRRESGFAALWDRLSGTRVVHRPKGSTRGASTPVERPASPAAEARTLGPYRLVEELVSGRWLCAEDPVLRRQVWLLRRIGGAPSPARREVARPGRVRWLQPVAADGATWDAYEAVAGTPFAELVAGGRRVPWGTLRHWLHDLAAELWAANGDGTLPEALSLAQVWITAQGRAVLLDEPWPRGEAGAEPVAVGDLAGQQRFLGAVAAHVEPTGLPLHARPALRNLAAAKYEKLSFLTGTLRGLLSRPTEVSRGIRAGAAFLLPTYTWIMILVGASQGSEWITALIGQGVGRLAVAAAAFVLAGSALLQLLEVPLRTTAGHATFRLAVVDEAGELARPGRLLTRWAILWLPLLLPLALVAGLLRGAPDAGYVTALLLIALWIAAAVPTALRPHRGLHDRLAGTWVVRR